MSEREPQMGARTKLNGAALNGVLIAAILVAIASGNIITGGVIGLILAVIAFVSGDIRLNGRS